MADPPTGVSSSPGDPTGSDLARDLLARARIGAGAGGADRRARGGRRSPAADRRSAAGPDARDPQLIGPLVDDLVAEQGWQGSVAAGGVEGRWDEIVGPEVAAHCRPEGCQEGILTVRAESTAWATQVRLLAPTLVARLNADLGDGTVLRVAVLGPDAPSWSKGRYRVKGRGPRDTYG
jgi:predicted nucleic acid-binding Zn ribbon protein